MRQKSYQRVRFLIQKQSECVNKYQVDMRKSEILYLLKKGLEKALELIGALDHGKTFRLCFFLARRNQYNAGKLLSVFVFKVNT